MSSNLDQLQLAKRILSLLFISIISSTLALSPITSSPLFYSQKGTSVSFAEPAKQGNQLPFFFSLMPNVAFGQSAESGEPPSASFSLTVTVTCPGSDTIPPGTAGPDTIVGGNGDNTINGGDGADDLFGCGGKDTINGQGDGDTTIDGGEGDDTLNGGAGNDNMLGGEGKDTINGGDGDDTIDGQNDDDTINGENGNDKILGGDGKDTILGGNNEDDIDGGNGDDILNGENGNDLVKGGAGNDDLNGGTGGGSDVIIGGPGNDFLHGDNGGDTLTGGPGADIFDCGNGPDTVTDFSAAEFDTFFPAPTPGNPTGNCETVQPADIIPPNTIIDDAVDGNDDSIPPGGTTPTDNMTFTYHGTDNNPISGLTFTCELTGPTSFPATDCTSPLSKTYSALPEGDYTF